MPSRQQQRQAFLDNSEWRETRVEELAQDASARSYFRLHGGAKPALLMDAPPPGESLTSFIKIATHLCELGVSAPCVYHADCSLGFALVEDFGDETFTRLLAKGHDERALYLLAIDCLLTIHNHPRAIAIELPRREVTFIDEVAVFCDWFYPLLNGRECPVQARSEFLAIWQKVFAARPVSHDVLVLRDFHVDNAMLLSQRKGVERCGLLDFQDATIGPPSYDIVSLLEDARRDISSAVVADCRARYLAHSEVTDSAEKFNTDCTILAAQRHCRVAGVFARLHLRDGKSHYLQHLSRVTRLLRGHLDNAALVEVGEWLDRFFAEFDDAGKCG